MTRSRVRDYLLEVSQNSESIQMRRAAMAALRHSNDGAAVERMRHVVEESKDSEEISEALGGLLARGDEFAVERATRMLSQGSDGERVAAANAIPYLLLCPSEIDTRVVDGVAIAITSDLGSRVREAMVASAQSLAVSERVALADRERLIAAFTTTAADGNAATNVRVAAVRSLAPMGPSARAMSQQLAKVAVDRGIPVEARVLAVKKIAEYATRVPESRLEVASTLSELQSQEGPADLRTAVQSALRSLEQAR